MTDEKSRQPQIDPAEENAFFPSAYSLSEFTAVSDLSAAGILSARGRE